MWHSVSIWHGRNRNPHAVPQWPVLKDLAESLRCHLMCIPLGGLELCFSIAGTILTGSFIWFPPGHCGAGTTFRWCTGSQWQRCHHEKAITGKLCLLCAPRLPLCAVIATHCPEFHHCFDRLADTERRPCGFFVPL